MTTVRFVTLVGAFFNAALSLVKVAGGYMVGSSALVADGLHSLSDLFSDALIIFGEGKWTAPADNDHKYGHARYETLVNLVLSISLLTVSVGLVHSAITDFGKPNELTMPIVAVVIALIGVIAKEFLFRWTLREAEKVSSKVLKANAHHHRSDALSSLPVVLAVLIQLAFPDATYVDEIATVVVAGMIGMAAFGIMMPIYYEFTEQTVSGDTERKVQQLRYEFSEIKEVHDIRVRTMGSTIVVDLHILVDPLINVHDAHEVSTKFKRSLLSDISHLTDVVIHIEPFVCSERHYYRCA
ncbi:cation diffusion facilitator family transporter [Vibrio crassostreae]|uniref:cation diffusion facilitator family transporter n=1 Tax=Vibrio crassostreae TaxID=246167 RepID=UPI001B311A19|nr:cation diffusion facilitator family transporter [Vibrio crassostreae]